MTCYDVFNGDADGICALVQLRRAEPREARLVTGVKRDIELLARVEPAAGDRITVLDISLEKNRAALDACLAAGAEVFYVDHHRPGERPSHPRLTLIVDEAPDVCTSLLVDRHLGGRFALWALVGAFGDNLREAALRRARELDLDGADLERLEQLGIYINYNGYGPTVAELHFDPAELFRILSRHDDPRAFMAEDRDHFARLETGYREDMAKAEALAPLAADDQAAVFLLPAEPWARRVSGVFGNELANRHPQRAHAILTAKPEGGYVVSVRAPLTAKRGAAELCRQFPTGGGREAAAGINHLPEERLAEFIDRFRAPLPALRTAGR
ncbi:MAG: hypothetical protein KatS3mg124_2478 [Porticoccaceae bacterium]|nr:MAG: hypothetical protein KatS3mg124_2478 [Porticoccaceae bacterium]